MGKFKVEEFALASKHKEENFATEKLCYSCSKSHNPKLYPFKKAERHFYLQSRAHKSLLPKFEILERKCEHRNSKIKTVRKKCCLNFIENNSNNVSWEKSVKIKGVTIIFEIDTGATLIMVSEKFARKLFSGKLPLIKYKVKLQIYAKDSIIVLGE